VLPSLTTLIWGKKTQSIHIIIFISLYLNYCNFASNHDTFNNISVISRQSVLLVEEIRVPREKHRPVACHWHTLLYNVVSCTPRHERNSNSLLVKGTDCTGSCKSKYNTITTTTGPRHKETRESWSGDHRNPRIPNFEWDNERNETCCDLSYNLFISWPSKIYKFL
jgi:hypothetical protein